MTSRWKKIDKDNLPKGEVLCRDKNGFCLLGVITVNSFDKTLFCKQIPFKAMDDITHYFAPDELEEPLSEIDKIFEEAEEDINSGNFKEL